MEKVLPLRFTWDSSMLGLLLRTTMVYNLEEYRSDPVKRCHQHMAHNFNQDIDPAITKHVVHCVNHSSSAYVEGENGHLSILTPLLPSEAGSPYFPMCLKFLCKNSCPSGMNRRPTELVFTLEDHNHIILGRKTLLVRVCSCPKRDKKKAEAELAPKLAPKLKSTGKKIVSDKGIYNINMKVVGKENYLSVLKYAHDVMAGQAMKTGQYELFKPYMENILKKMP